MANEPQPTRLYFLDIEASSLNSGSFPIEIAWVDAAGQGESYLIIPQADWTDWSTASQNLHGISRDQLCREGRPASVVANRVWEVLHNAVICSDNPAFDYHWLSMLLAVSGLEALPLADLYSILNGEVRRTLRLIEPEENTTEWRHKSWYLRAEGRTVILQQREIDRKRQEIFGNGHRALPDAEGMWRCWQQVRDWVDQRLVGVAMQ